VRNGASIITDAIGDVVGGAIDWGKGLLGINSPSRVFMEMGHWIDEGLAKGMEDNVGTVRDSAETLASAPVSAIDELLRDLSFDFEDMLDGDPTITPVLDLSEVEKRAGAIDGLLGGQSLSGNAYGRTSALSMERRESAKALRELEAEANRPKTEIKLDYQKNISSPEPVST
ncbi:phage tail protein, partial [Moraxella catarrhalis]|uniref:phage tail protein n=1 Tax=Moraxella catarrhalis TaxID=480 RepID=UPI000ECCC2B7